MSDLDSAGARPMVSIVLAVRNERAHIEKAALSLLNQHAPDFDLELLVIDGCSEDGSDEIVRVLAENDPRVRLVNNPQRRTPFAFNIGLREARGEYICIFGAHAQYDEDYISVCLRELKARGAVGCSGRVVTCASNDSLQAQLVAAALVHPFGSSRSSVRTQREGFVDTIPFPVFRRQALLDAGGYDEELYRNQDNDMNQRLRARGHKLWLTWSTEARYFVKPTVRSLMSYAFLTGYWNVISLARNKSSMGLRHFVPFLFVCSLVMSAAVALGGVALHSWFAVVPFLAIVGLYSVVAGSCAIKEAIGKARPYLLVLPFVWFAFHAAYGLGTAKALIASSEWLREQRKRAAVASG